MEANDKIKINVQNGGLYSIVPVLFFIITLLDNRWKRLKSWYPTSTSYFQSKVSLKPAEQRPHWNEFNFQKITRSTGFNLNSKHIPGQLLSCGWEPSGSDSVHGTLASPHSRKRAHLILHNCRSGFFKIKAWCQSLTLIKFSTTKCKSILNL